MNKAGPALSAEALAEGSQLATASGGNIVGREFNRKGADSTVWIEVSTKGIRAEDISKSDGMTVMALISGVFDFARRKDERNSEHFLDPDYEYDFGSVITNEVG